MNEEHISKKLLGLNALLVILIIGMTFAVSNALTSIPETSAEISVVRTSTALDSIQVDARSAYVFDMAEGRPLFEKNAVEQLPLASITKLMTALVAARLVPEDSQITIRKEFLVEEGDNGLTDGETWKLRDLLDFSLVVSSNDGARALASVIGAEVFKTDFDIGKKEFIAEMNDVAQDIGLSGMYFVNESGLDLDSVSGGYGTAQDVSGLFAYIIRNNPELLEATIVPKTVISSETQNHTARNTNTSIEKIPGLLGSKTGYTSLAGGNLAIAFDAGLGHPIVIVVLGSTQEGRFTDVEKLVNASLDYVQNSE